MLQDLSAHRERARGAVQNHTKLTRLALCSEHTVPEPCSREAGGAAGRDAPYNTHTFTRTHTHTHVRVHRHTHMHTHMHRHARTHTCTHAQTHKHTYI